MSPTNRLFRELVDTVARVYDMNTDELTTENQYAPAGVHEARQVVCLVAVEVLGVSQRQVAKLMQRDPRAINNGLKVLRAKLEKSPLLRRVVDQVTKRTKRAVQEFDVFAREAAE